MPAGGGPGPTEPRFSKIAYYLRDNGILIHVIRFEGSGQ
jgi:hypothetical protein